MYLSEKTLGRLDVLAEMLQIRRSEVVRVLLRDALPRAERRTVRSVAGVPPLDPNLQAFPSRSLGSLTSYGDLTPEPPLLNPAAPSP